MNISAVLKKIDAYERLMRLDKPIGILLLLWPTLMALLVAGRGKPDISVVMLFITGTVLMRSAGCVMNDLADQSFDGLVERTRLRPLATHELSRKEAASLAAALSMIAFGLVWQLNALTIQLSVLALFLAATYPLTKRFFAMPQAYLGLAFGFGIPMAFAAIHGFVPPIAWVLLVANIFWAIAYDTEYAMVDRDDDLKIGIRSSAITFGRYDVASIMFCYAMTLALLVFAGKWLMLGYWYDAGVAIAALVAVRHYFLIRTRHKAQCFQAFIGNNWFGFAVCVGLAADYWL